MIWGSLCNYRHLGPRRVWKGGSDLQSDPPFSADPLDPVDPLQNNGRLILAIKNIFLMIFSGMIAVFCPGSLQRLCPVSWTRLLRGVCRPLGRAGAGHWAGTAREETNSSFSASFPSPPSNKVPRPWRRRFQFVQASFESTLIVKGPGSKHEIANQG